MITMYFGVPGCGKTTLANILLQQEQRRKKQYDHYYANFDTPYAVRFDPQQLVDQVPPDNSLIIIDESGIEFGSRSFKSFNKGLIEFFKKHRHHKCDIIYFSQAYDDTDKIIRDMTEALYCIKRLTKHFSIVQTIKKKTGVNKDTHQIEYQYRISKLPKLVFLPLGYTEFKYSPLKRNTFDSDDLPFRHKISFFRRLGLDLGYHYSGIVFLIVLLLILNLIF